MSNKKNWPTNVQRIIQSIAEIEACVRKIVKDADITKLPDLPDPNFFADQVGRRLIEHNFEIIGKTTSRIPSNIQSAHHDIPWEKMKSMQDLAIHQWDVIHETDYSTSETFSLWKAIRNDLPGLKDQLLTLLSPPHL